MITVLNEIWERFCPKNGVPKNGFPIAMGNPFFTMHCFFFYNELYCIVFYNALYCIVFYNALYWKKVIWVEGQILGQKNSEKANTPEYAQVLVVTCPKLNSVAALPLLLYKAVKLVGGGSVINGAYPA